MLGQLLTAQAIANSIAEGRPTLSTLKTDQNGPGTGGAASGDVSVAISLSDIAQQLLGGDADTSGGGFRSLGEVLGADAQAAYGGFVEQALGKFTGGVADLASKVFDLPIEDALVAVREATADLRQQLDGRGDVQAQFIAVVAASSNETINANGTRAEANVDFKSVTIAFDDDTNAFSLSIDEVSISKAEAAALQTIEGEDGVAQQLAAYSQETSISIKSFDYVRLEAQPTDAQDGDVAAPLFRTPDFGAGLLGVTPETLSQAFDDDALLPVPTSLLRKLISLPDPEEAKPVEPAVEAVEPLTIDDVAAEAAEPVQTAGVGAQTDADAGADGRQGRTDDPILQVPARLWRQINQNLGDVSAVSFDLRIRQQAASAFFFGQSTPAVNSSPPPASLDVEA